MCYVYVMLFSVCDSNTSFQLSSVLVHALPLDHGVYVHNINSRRQLNLATLRDGMVS